MSKHRSIQSTVTPDGWEPAPHKEMMWWYPKFIRWMQYVKTGESLRTN